jgi:hypothetical protein
LLLTGEGVDFRGFVLEAHDFRDVLDTVDDPFHLAVPVQDRTVERAPILFLEGAVRAANVVSLDGRGVRSSQPQHSLQRGTKVVEPGGARIFGVFREHLERRAADNVGPLRERGLQISVAGFGDGQIGGQHQVRPGNGLKNGLKVRDNMHISMHKMHSQKAWMTKKVRYAGNPLLPSTCGLTGLPLRILSLRALSEFSVGLASHQYSPKL